MSAQPTPFPEINAVLHLLLAGVRQILGDQFVGLYLYGSLSSGDFNPRSSDIDFLVVTTGELPMDTVGKLEALHQELGHSANKWAAKLEGSYLPLAYLRRYDPTAPPCPQINEGRFFTAVHGSDWIIQRHILREQGVALAGPPLQPLIDPVQPAEIRQGVRGILQEWWAPMLEDPTFLERRDYQAFAVLTMCRALYTLAHGEIASKPASARWARQQLAAEWAPVIDQALRWPQEPQPDMQPQTLALLRHTLAVSQSA